MKEENSYELGFLAGIFCAIICLIIFMFFSGYELTNYVPLDNNITIFCIGERCRTIDGFTLGTMGVYGNNSLAYASNLGTKIVFDYKCFSEFNESSDNNINQEKVEK